MNLNKLKHVVALAEQGNFARAADKLNLSQPALSRSISGLEDELGIRLFDRDQAGATVTAAGRQLVTRARDLLYAANNLRQEMAQLRDCESGQIVFGAGPFPANSFLPAVLTELAITYPRMRTVLEVNNSDTLMEHLLAEKLEFFIADTRTVRPNKHVKVRHLTQQAGGLYCRREHPLATKTLLNRHDLQSASYASVYLADIFLPSLRKAFGLEAGQDLPLVTTCDNIYVLKQVVMHSDAILLCTHAAVVKELEEGDLVELKVDGWHAIHAEIGVVSLERRSLSPMADLVLAKVAGHI
ncbi:LysR family transcriptional regulator [Undibacterium sp. CY18W]|uniref:LysR family transcriptional regulator n=1 Tax=Undibacterium hunanense TaxID=2762292 RepID=A0ABR6ZLH4_9BURK|nr:LysR family transcriptional regulator [Undibacterium hunanense]MBC3916644.1 LysR family transcriptional regulator [Undibacterium hunanense]